MKLSLLPISEYFEALHKEIGCCEHFVFGSDEKALRESVAGFHGIFMFVDFGEIPSSIDRNSVLKDEWLFAVTLAKPFGANPMSYRDICASQDKTLRGIMQVKKRLFAKNATGWLRDISGSSTTMPFVAPDMNRSIGWTLSFRFEGVDLFGIRE